MLYSSSIRGWRVAVALVVAGCGAAGQRAPAPSSSSRSPDTAAPIATADRSTAAPGALTISILGTSDLHGALDRLPVLAGYVDNVRAARRADGGGVIVLDAGDMFQGTLESNLNEGQAVIAAYGAIGYTA